MAAILINSSLTSTYRRASPFLSTAFRATASVQDSAGTYHRASPSLSTAFRADSIPSIAANFIFIF